MVLKYKSTKTSHEAHESRSQKVDVWRALLDGGRSKNRKNAKTKYTYFKGMASGDDGKIEEKSEEDRRREEIIARVALAKAEKERERLTYFGTHKGISCDGCGLPAPLVGFRYHCKSCANHDVCEACFKAWDNKKGTISNVLNQQKLSTDPKDHDFILYKDKGFKAMAKGGGAREIKATKKTKPNDVCPCGSTRKFKKCCGSVVLAH